MRPGQLRWHPPKEEPFVQRCREAKKLPFLDEQPMVGDPDCSWSRFRQPLLRKCPFEGPIEFGDRLGYGVDGVVWEVSIEGRAFALKVTWDNVAPEGTRYYAIQRECHNVALLQMIQSAVGASTEPIYLHPEPKTLKDALANLMSFSDEGRRKQRLRNRPDAVQFTSTPRLRECFGWMRVSGEQLLSLPQEKRPPCDKIDGLLREMRPDETYYAILYELVLPRNTIAAKDTIQALLDFFWLTGFCFVPMMRTEEWFRFEVFTDMSDLICPWHAGWSEKNYGRLVVNNDGPNISIRRLAARAGVQFHTTNGSGLIKS